MQRHEITAATHLQHLEIAPRNIMKITLETARGPKLGGVLGESSTVQWRRTSPKGSAPPRGQGLVGVVERGLTKGCARASPPKLVARVGSPSPRSSHGRPRLVLPMLVACVRLASGLESRCPRRGCHQPRAPISSYEHGR